MLAALVALWRRRPVVIYLIGGAVLAGILLALTRFDGTPGGKAVFAVFLWLVASACVAAVFWTFELVADLLRWIRRRGAGPATPGSFNHTGPLPELSPARQARVRRAVEMLTQANVFQPDALDPAMLYAGIAESEAPVRPDTIFAALAEADYYHPGFDRAACMANLVLHETQVEQTEAYLSQQVADFARLSGGALAITDVAVAQSRRSDGAVDTRIAMTVNGEDVALAYSGAEKALSTVLHHDLATRMRAPGNGQRFAWLWDDAGPWISCLPDGAVEELNAAFRLGGTSPWRWIWIDAEPPLAAGER